ncbi:MAG: redox-regulated ATPase YchF [Thermoproteota archaeon]|nr:redox-regulated ATPase YchF [Thermoproteota archaeon]
MQIGLIGKANVGKSTFFNAATDMNVETANYPFTTIAPNIGICYARQRCVCNEFGLQDNPIHSICIDGVRFIPVQIVDIAGLVPGAHLGKGLGNQFLDDARQADALVHVVDVAGSTDKEGRASSSGSFDPTEDVIFVEEEFDLWLMSIIKRDWAINAKDGGSANQSNEVILRKRLSGLGIKESAIDAALNISGLKTKKINTWTEQDILFFTKTVREKSKPLVIAANKADISAAEMNIQAISKKYNWVIPCTSEGESLLRKAAKKGIVHYLPGDDSFEIRNTANVTEKQRHALEVVSKFIIKYGSTGIQKVINTICFDILAKIVVYPVENEVSLTDKKGNILPEAYLVDRGTTAKHLASMIHQDLEKGFLFAIDVRTKKRVGAEYQLKNNDIIKIVSVLNRS